MMIIDTFEFEDKLALYCKADNLKSNNYKLAIIGNKEYNIIKSDIMRSISGDCAITILIDTNDIIVSNQTIELK